MVEKFASLPEPKLVQSLSSQKVTEQQKAFWGTKKMRLVDSCALARARPEGHGPYIRRATMALFLGLGHGCKGISKSVL
jgi:hypothetical protein